MQKRGGEWVFRGSYSNEYEPVCLSLSRKLEGVIAELERISDQPRLIMFLNNVENAKTLAGFIQELADAVTDYQVRATSPTAIFN